MSDYGDLDGLDFEFDDNEAATDEAVLATADRSAKPFARFYNRLKAEKVDHDTAQELTILYARKIWEIYD